MTGLLAYKIWTVDSSLEGSQKSPLKPVAYVLIESGVIHTVLLLTILATVLTNSYAQFVATDLVSYRPLVNNRLPLKPLYRADH